MRLVKFSPVFLSDEKGVEFCVGSIYVMGPFVVRAFKPTDLRFFVHSYCIPLSLIDFITNIIKTLHHKYDFVDIIEL